MWWEDFLRPAGILAAAGMIATGYAVVKTQSNKFLRQTNDDLRKRIDDKDAELADKDRDLVEKDAKLASQSAAMVEKDRELEVVKKVVTGETHWVALEQLLHEAITALRKVSEKVDELLRRGGS